MVSNRSRASNKEASKVTKTLPDFGEADIFKLRAGIVERVARTISGDVLEQVMNEDLSSVMTSGSDLLFDIVIDGMRIEDPDEASEDKRSARIWVEEELTVPDLKEAFLSTIEVSFGKDGFRGFFGDLKPRLGLEGLSLGEMREKAESMRNPANSSTSSTTLPPTDQPMTDDPLEPVSDKEFESYSNQ